MTTNDPSAASAHGKRMPFISLVPHVYQAMIGLEAAAKKGLAPSWSS
jgi:hypothetical protein